jgi:1,4-alpha-glucan branching enzyme
MISTSDIDLVCNGRHNDAFAVLGPHRLSSNSIAIRAFFPGAIEVRVIELHNKKLIGKLTRINSAGFFERSFASDGVFRNGVEYRFKVRWASGLESIVHDPYRYASLLSDMDLWLLAEGTHVRPYEVMGAHEKAIDLVQGTQFTVWAPNASYVGLVGDFNAWDPRRYPMRLRRECGVWEIFLPDLALGALYKFFIRSSDGSQEFTKADPYARRSELRPATASITSSMPQKVHASQQRKQANALNAPMSIYEVHLGSWRRRDGKWLDWKELCETLIPYVKEMGFTHIELMPIQEHPFDGSWGYQPIGLYCPTARFGSSEDFAMFVSACHLQDIGVLLDWVPAHFPSDSHGLANFDGTHLYEYADPKEGFHTDWNTLIYNFGRTEVRNFLLGNSLYWLDRYGIDGLRVDAVSSLLYRDYSRQPGQWIPNVHGGRENLEAISLLQRMNEIIGTERPESVSIAEESTAYPAVSRPTYSGGLGFHYKWNMGWMHDTLQYISRDPVHRQHHHNELTFSLAYAFNENFILPISHDEVVHGKGSLLNKMPGDEWQKFANLRAYLGFMYGHPGKKLLFMGCEFAQVREWNHDHSLDWHLLDEASNPGAKKHIGIQRLVRDLNRFYRESKPLHQQDFIPDGFQWIELHDAQRSIISFIRRDEKANAVIVLCNFTPTPYQAYRLGVPSAGVYLERINSDSEHYGGSNLGTAFAMADSQHIEWQGQPHSIVITVPPLATVMYELKR